MPAALARSAMLRPTLFAASMLPVPLSPAATSFCSVEALAEAAREAGLEF